MTEPPAAHDASVLASGAGADMARAFAGHWRTSLLALTLVTVAVAVAWQDHIGRGSRVLWCSLACLNYLAQGLVFNTMERAGVTEDSVSRWMPWILASVACSSATWGTLPWLLSAPGPQTMLQACAFNVLLAFCVAATPGTRAMMTCAVAVMGATTSLAPMVRLHLLAESVAVAALFGVIWLYGARLEEAILATFRQRRIADELTRSLREQQSELVRSERLRAVLSERERLMRDMHDGIGATLTASLISVESGATSPQAVAQMLRECLDELRLVIDSLESDELGIGELLANLRFRLRARLSGNDVNLVWRIAEPVPGARLTPMAALQVLRIVQEMITNALKHAQARTVIVEVRDEHGALRVRVEDDGIGFDPTAPAPGRGLRFLRQRAGALGATLAIDSMPGRGTTVLLNLPAVAPEPTVPSQPSSLSSSATLDSTSLTLGFTSSSFLGR